MKLFVRDREFYITVARIAVPVALQSVISIGINMMDTVMLGTFGEVQISASSLASQFYRIFQVLCMGMGFGASVMTAQYWGRRGYTVSDGCGCFVSLDSVSSAGRGGGFYLEASAVLDLYQPEM